MNSLSDLQLGQSGPGLSSESERIAALESYAILDTPNEPGFDDLVRLAAGTFGAPIAVVNLVAGDRQWFKAEVGIGTREMPLDVSTSLVRLRGLLVCKTDLTMPRRI